MKCIFKILFLSLCVIQMNAQTNNITRKRSQRQNQSTIQDKKTSTNHAKLHGVSNGHEWVDLGLSVKWATCNIGASASHESGQYFSFGEVKPKQEYSDATLIYRGEANVNLSHDVARVNWGKPWRLPTRANFNELCKKCEWKWTQRNGCSGYLVKGKNGNCIFLPASGFIKGNYKFTLENSNGMYGGVYWSSSYTDYAQAVHFNAQGYCTGGSGSCLGCTIRPVIGK